jgi:hypothetical protein
LEGASTSDTPAEPVFERPASADLEPEHFIPPDEGAFLSRSGNGATLRLLLTTAPCTSCYNHTALQAFTAWSRGEAQGAKLVCGRSAPPTLRVPVEGVALIQKCAECEARWLPDAEERWQARLGCDEYLDEPAEPPSTARSALGGSSRFSRSALTR